MRAIGLSEVGRRDRAARAGGSPDLGSPDRVFAREPRPETSIFPALEGARHRRDRLRRSLARAPLRLEAGARGDFRAYLPRFTGENRARNERLVGAIAALAARERRHGLTGRDRVGAREGPDHRAGRRARTRPQLDESLGALDVTLVARRRGAPRGGRTAPRRSRGRATTTADACPRQRAGIAMCRFALYVPGRHGRLAETRPAHSILKQSLHAEEREDPTNGDGFGVGWYVPELGPEPALYRSPVPAWNDPNLLHISRVSKSPCILAHVRAASPGTAVSVSNCHPFASGPFAFMHNGGIGGFPRIRRRLEAGLSEEAFAGIQGTTDSDSPSRSSSTPREREGRGLHGTDGRGAHRGRREDRVDRRRRRRDRAVVPELRRHGRRRAVVMRYATPPRVPASLWGPTDGVWSVKATSAA